MAASCSLDALRNVGIGCMAGTKAPIIYLVVDPERPFGPRWLTSEQLFG